MAWLSIDDLDEEQKKALEKCLDPNERIVAVTGAAGTGKTTLLRLVYEHFLSMKYNPTLAAPTGKAAKRIQEATGIEARTIHRLLEYPHPGERDEKTGKPLNTSDPKRDRFNRLVNKVVLVDEYAMVNSEVHRNLIDALPNGGLIRVFGDINQLPPIEGFVRKGEKRPPSPFETILEKFTGIVLKTIHRQAEQSPIIYNGNRIIRGQMPKRFDDFSIKFTENPVRAIQDHVMEVYDQGIDFTKIENQIIVPMNKSWIGTASLNHVIQSLFRSTIGAYELERHRWADDKGVRVSVGDKVMFTANNYTLEVFNGETGIITEIDELGAIEVDLGDRSVVVPPALEVPKGPDNTVIINPQRDMTLAYVVTTHKSQGSEFNHICYIMNKSSFIMQNRRNFYTAITRARKSVAVFSDQKSITSALYKRGD